MIWLMATLTALPILVMSDLFIPELSSWHQNGGHYVCQERWSDPSQQTLYTTILLLLQFCFPLAIISFNYGCIFIEIWSKKVPGEANQDRDLRLARSKQKVNYHLFCLALIHSVWCHIFILEDALLSIKFYILPVLHQIPGINCSLWEMVWQTVFIYKKWNRWLFILIISSRFHKKKCSSFSSIQVSTIRVISIDEPYWRVTLRMGQI